MKRMLKIVPALLLALSLMGCASPPASPAEEGGSGAAALEPLAESYYAGQGEPAFGKLRKHIFQELLGQWADGVVENPVWAYDTFARYAVLGPDLSPVGEETLYCCAFTAGDGKHGYVVLSYDPRDGGGLGKVELVETARPYDLRADLEGVSAALEGRELDLSTAEASRARLAGADGGAAEAIRITDGAGHDYLYGFAGSALL